MMLYSKDNQTHIITIHGMDRNIKPVIVSCTKRMVTVQSGGEGDNRDEFARMMASARAVATVLVGTDKPLEPICLQIVRTHNALFRQALTQQILDAPVQVN